MKVQECLCELSIHLTKMAKLTTKPDSVKMMTFIWLGFLLTAVNGKQVADVVLSCDLVEEGGMAGMRGSALFSRTAATLVLRDVTVAPDQSLETITPFVPPSDPDPDAILIEARVSSPEIPNADVLLHADCNEQEVMCEFSRYFSRGAQDTSDPAYFMVSVDVEGAEFSATLILQAVAVNDDESTLVQNKLGLPLSQSGTLLTEVVFLVFAPINSVSAPLRGDALLTCGFKLQERPPAPQVEIEWRLQHRGKGQKVLEMKTRLDDVEEGTVVHAERMGSSMDAAQVVSEGDASVTLSELRVLDEGTYICTVSVGFFQAQQVIQLQITQPPHVSLSEKELILKPESTQTLSCRCTKYYPLDAQVEWLLLSPTDSEPTALPDQGALSSHRRHGDGTYSLSSHLTVPPSVSPGTKVICKVSHLALDTPLSVSLMVESPQADTYWWILGFLIVTVLLFNQVMR